MCDANHSGLTRGGQKPGFYVNIYRKNRRFLEETGFFCLSRMTVRSTDSSKLTSVNCAQSTGFFRFGMISKLLKPLPQS